MAFDALLIGQRALQASQSGLMVAGQNLANAASPGYSRQEIVLAPSPGPPALNLPRGVVTDAGDTVQVLGVRRFRDAFIDDAWRMQNGVGTAADIQQQTLDRASALLEETDSSGLSFAATGFLQRIKQAASAPQDGALRQLVLASAQSLAADMRGRAQGLQSLSDEVENRARGSVDDINNLLKQLATANVYMPTNTPAGNEGLDQRDRLVDALSGKLDIQAVPQPDGTLSISLHGVNLVHARTARSLQITRDIDGNLQITTDGGKAVSPKDGELGAYVDLHNRALPALRTALDVAANALRTAVDDRLANGWDLHGQAGGALFSGSGATDLQAVIADPAALAFAVGSVSSATSVLASGALSLQATLASQPLATTPTTSGVLAVNGVDIAWSDQSTPAELIDAFTTAGVNASYDTASGRFTLTRDPTQPGGPDITLTDVSGNLSSVLQLSGIPLDKGLPGDGQVAESIATLLTRPLAGTLPSQTLSTTLQGVASAAANQAGNARATFQAADTLRASLDGTRTSESGVNTDEEGIKMLQFQRAYEAAARLVSIQDAMLDTLINRMT